MTTQVRRDVVGVDGDECTCGRRATVLHCIACGSTRIYARSNRVHEHLDGSSKYVAVQYRCQTCGHLFITDERMFCEAPPVSAALARLKVQRLAQAKARGEFLRPEDQQVADAIEKAQAVISKEQEPLVVEQSFVKSVDDIQASPEIEAATDSVPRVEVEHPGLTKAEYDIAERAFRMEWVNQKLAGTPYTIPVEQYVARRLKGEVINE